MLTSSIAATTICAAPSVNELQQNKQEAEEKVKSLESELTSVMSKINDLETELVEKGQQVIKATEDLEKAEEKEKKQYEEMKRRIVAMYENGDTVLMTKIFEAGSFAEMQKQAEYMEKVHTYDREQLEEYVKTKEKIANLKESLEKDMKKIESMQVEYEAEKESLNATILEAKDQVEDFDKKIQEAAAEAAERERLRNEVVNGRPGSGGNGASDYVPPANSGGGQAIVNAATQYLGVPYVWGGASSSGVDCSGLVLLAHRAIGVNLSHSSGAQGSGGKAVPNMASALPGDVVCYPGHVGIYVGGGKMIHAPQSGDVVKIVNVFGSPWFRRYW